MGLYQAAQLLYDWNPRPGVVIEVGAHDGGGWSQGLEDHGWTAICLEPHPHWFQVLRKNRPKAILCNAAASNRNGRAQLLMTKEGICSSIEPGIEHVIREVYHNYTVEGYEDVPCTTLDSLFGTLMHYLKPGIDAVIIDTEGHELAVLEGFDLKRWRPRLLMVEQLPFNQLAGMMKVRSVDKLIEEAGYMLVGHTGPDSFYAWQSSDIAYWEGQLEKRWFGTSKPDARIVMGRYRRRVESRRIQ